MGTSRGFWILDFGFWIISKLEFEVAQRADASATLGVPTATTVEGLGTEIERRMVGEKVCKGQLRSRQSSTKPTSLALRSMVAIPAIALSAS